MKYMGSKNRHAKELLPIILADRKEGQWYVEPFVGGFNMIDKVSGNRLANDQHEWLIELFKAIQGGWIPPDELSEDDYKELRNYSEMYYAPLVAFAGFGCSFAGKWFGGYARGNDANGNPRNYCLESKKNIMAQAQNLQGIVIKSGSYLDLEIPPESIIYCDPPYAGTTKYSDKFDHCVFWNWCRTMVQLGHKVFVSEYNAPEDWGCVWSKKVNNTLVKNTGSKQGVEKLFKMKGI